MSVRVCVCLRMHVLCVSLRVTSVSVPEARARGSSATLACDFELEGARLYSVKWYKDNEEFYRYMPRVRPPQHAYQLDGITVDLDKSSARRVYLRNLTLRSRGLYRCEVSEEAPAFYSAQAEAFMEVYYFPREGPIITGHERRYQEGQPLDINCTSAKVFPAPALQWQINGEKVTEPIWLMSYGVQPDSTGLVVSTLALHAPARLKMKLRCLVTVGMHRREKTVVIEEVERRPCLWDLQDTNNKNRECRAQAWDEVLHAVIPDYSKLSKKHKKELERSVQQRWKNARDCYVKHKKQKTTKYVYYDKLTFLEGSFEDYTDFYHNEADDTIPNVKTELDCSTDTAIQKSSSSNEDVVEPNIPKYRQKRRKRYKFEFQKDIFSPHIELSDDLQRDDVAFFLSLAPTINTFDNNQKIIFRSKVLQAAMEIIHFNNVASLDSMQSDFKCNTRKCNKKEDSDATNPSDSRTDSD
ncbi:hypothetical protein EVAR_9593_1 [Eumeta japonica]|uniref:Ig-like domain-containing protein n=1 Tax=Eumeta variegata TaxID=151549 RepID=A0A4C1TKQ6_EUMVA|nr:hypothetical protein EVAR_9593_1 [Eumeta japonica]